MKRLILSIALVAMSLIGYGQELSLIFSRVIKETPDTVWCELKVWQKGPDGFYSLRSKEFADQMMISLAPGEYFLEYSACDSILYCDQLVLNEEPSTIIFNLLLEPTPLTTFDFSRAIFVTPEIYYFVNRKEVYMEF